MVGLEGKTLRVMLVDDNRIVRDGLTIFFKLFNDLEYVGAATNGIEAIHLCEAVSPDVILMDVMMPKMNGIEATQAIKDQYPDIKIIGFTSVSSLDGHVQAMLDAGADVCLPKQASIDEIVRAIRGS